MTKFLKTIATKDPTNHLKGSLHFQAVELESQEQIKKGIS